MTDSGSESKNNAVASKSGKDVESGAQAVTGREKKTSKISSKSALMNLVEGIWGAGCFTLPMAFKQAGWAMGFAIVVMINVFTIFTMYKIIECANFLCKQYKTESLDYGRMAYKAVESSWAPLKKWAPMAKTAVNVSLVAMQLGMCCVCYIFVVYQTHEFLELVLPTAPDRDSLFPLLLPAFLLLGSSSSMKALSVISVIGNSLMAVSVVVIFYELASYEHKSLAELPAVTNLAGFVSASGVALYSLEAQALVLPLENKMKRPEQMGGPCGVISIGMNSVTLVYMFVGFVGFKTFGNGVEDTIVLNLPNNVPGLLVKSLLLLAVYTGFLIQMLPIFVTIWPSIEKKLSLRGASQNSRRAVRILFRLSIVFATFLATIIVPRLQDMIPLIGVSAGMLVAFVFPGLFHLLLFAPQLDKLSSWSSWTSIVVDIFFIAIGLFFVVVGVSENLPRLLKEDLSRLETTL